MLTTEDIKIDRATAPGRAARAEAEVERLRVDAGRYRWLRSRNADTIDRGGVFAGKTPDNLILTEVDLDQAIDAAMAQTSEPVGA